MSELVTFLSSAFLLLDLRRCVSVTLLTPQDEEGASVHASNKTILATSSGMEVLAYMTLPRCSRLAVSEQLEQ